MRCALEAGGRFRTAENFCQEKYGVSKGYLRDLFYKEKHIDWQIELKRRLVRSLPRGDELDEDYIIRGLMELTGKHIQDSVRLGAFRSLGDLLGMWAPKEAILRVEDLRRLEDMGITKEEIWAEVEEILNDGLRSD